MLHAVGRVRRNELNSSIDRENEMLILLAIWFDQLMSYTDVEILPSPYKNVQILPCSQNFRKSLIFFNIRNEESQYGLLLNDVKKKNLKSILTYYLQKTATMPQGLNERV